MTLFERMMIGVLVSALAGYIYMTAQISSLKEELMSIRLSNNTKIIQSLEKLEKSRRDTVFFYNNTVKYLERRKAVEESNVVSANDIDSLIRIYYKHRSNLPN